MVWCCRARGAAGAAGGDNSMGRSTGPLLATHARVLACRYGDVYLSKWNNCEVAVKVRCRK